MRALSAAEPQQSH